MNKTQEIEILREAISKLGRSSYCGPWLASVIEEVEAEIRSDYFPSPSLSAAKRESDKVKADAKEYVDALIAAATKTADNIRTEARSTANTIIEGAIEKLNAAKLR